MPPQAPEILKADTETVDRLSLKTARDLRQKLGDRLAKLYRLSKIKKLTETDFLDVIADMTDEMGKKLRELGEIDRKPLERLREALHI